MTESFTLYLFVSPNFLCTTCVASWLFVPWKKCWRGVVSQSYFTSCPSENIFFRQTTTCKKRTKTSRKHLLRRDSDSRKEIAGQRRQTFSVGAKSHLRWQVPLDKLVNLTSWLDKLTCHIAHLPLFESLDKLLLVKLTCQVNVHNPHITQVKDPELTANGNLLFCRVLNGPHTCWHFHKCIHVYICICIHIHINMNTHICI